MRLLEIELRNWRGLDQTLAVLSPRLNLILGPNESGKSRIFQALHFGLFETHKGAAQRKQALQSWASPESPFVRIVFSDGAVQYELQKQFLKAHRRNSAAVAAPCAAKRRRSCCGRYSARGRPAAGVRKSTTAGSGPC